METKMTNTVRRALRFALAGSAATLLLVGCGDSSSPETTEAVQQAPLQAAFNASRMVAPVGSPVVFDATATQGGEGPLTFSWDFGNGRLGGTEKIPQLFSLPGTYNVILTVRDQSGQISRAERAIEVIPDGEVRGEMDLHVEVVSLDGESQSDVLVEVTGLEGEWRTDENGVVTVPGLAIDRTHTLRFGKEGYAPQVVRRKFEAGFDAPRVRAIMLPVTERVRVASIQDGGVASSRDGARVEFGPQGVVDQNGNFVEGEIDVYFTILDVSSDERDAFPGGYDAVNTAGEEGILLTYGVMDVSLRQNGQPLQIAPGHSARIDIPIFNEGYVEDRDMELWSLDESTGVWVQEGWGRTVASAESPTGVVLRGEAGHFSWWNADTWASTPCVLEIIPTCTNEDEVEVPVPGRFEADFRFSMGAAQGYGNACTPLTHTRNVSSYRHGTSFPAGTRLEGQMCDPQFADLQCFDQSGSVPAGVTCKIEEFGRTRIPVGVCTRSTDDPCGQYMYCEPSADGNGGRCVPPMYRYGQANQTSISLFQNYDGWGCRSPNCTTGRREIRFDEGSTSRTIRYAHVPMGPIKVEIDYICAPELGDECSSGTPLRTIEREERIYPVTYNGITITDPFHSAGLPVDPNWRPPMDWTCTPEPTKINVGECAEIIPDDDPEPECGPTDTNNYPQCCDEPGNEDKCPPGEIVIECTPNTPLGVNDIPGFCEVDAIIVNRSEGFVTEPLFITKTEVDLDLSAGQRGVAAPETISSVNFTTCEPGQNGDGWKPHVGYFRSRLVVEFAGELKPGDLVRVFRQGVPANETNAEGQNCAASGTLTVRLPGSTTPLVQDVYNSFEVRVRDQHIP